MTWGYNCCHSHIFNSYCVGDIGKESSSVAGRLGGINASAGSGAGPSSTSRLSPEAGVNEDAEGGGRRKTLVEKHQERERERGYARAESDSRKGKDKEKEREGDDEKYIRQAKRLDDGELPELDKDRLKRAMDREKKRKEMGEEEAWAATKKGKMDVTQEEVEAYRLSKQAFDDPMANYKDPDE